MVGSIALPTDFSESGARAFRHALRLAVAYKSQLDLLHVRSFEDNAEWDRFPKVRDTLNQWGLLPEGASPSDVDRLLGVKVRKVDIRDTDAVGGVASYLERHKPDLMVMASHGRAGINRWLSGSISEQIASETNCPSLLFGPGARDFVDPDSGEISLNRVAVPVDHNPPASKALAKIGTVLGGLGVVPALFHVGDRPPVVRGADGAEMPVDLRGGDPVEAILAESGQADLLAMPTEGRHGFLDIIRGSTTERVLHEAACPVLTVQVGGS